MQEERKPDEIEQEGTAPGSSPEDQPDQGQRPDGDDQGGHSDREGKSDQGKPENGKEEEFQIPKHRFDEVSRENRELKQQVGDLTKKFSNMASALQGQSQDTKDQVIQQFAQKYNVPDEFVDGMLGLAEKRVSKRFEKELYPVKAQQAKTAFNAELNDLFEDIPEARDMSKEDREELQKMAYDPKYSKTPLSDIYKIVNFGKPQGTPTSVESGRGGTRKPKDSNAEADIANMSLEEFEAYSEKLAKDQG